MSKKSYLGVKIMAAITFAAMIFVNFLANWLPIGGNNTGEISDAYANLFAPASITFSIWGLIYLLLAFYVVYQFLMSAPKGDKEDASWLRDLNLYFIASSIANISWIFAWHYRVIPLSLIMTAIMLFSLIKIADIIKRRSLTKSDKAFIRLPFSVYFGWITVATIANVAVLLVSLGWRGGSAESLWTVIVLFVGAAIGIARTLSDRNIPYALVLIWAYAGICLKHSSMGYYQGEYPGVILAAALSIVMFAAAIIGLLAKKKA